MMGEFKHKSSKSAAKDLSDDQSDDSEDEDNLEDIPDTREYMPLDLEGLQSLGIGGSKMMGDEGYTMEDLKNMTMNNIELDGSDEDEEDQDDVDDIRLQDGDALIVVAKTEDDFASLEINIFDAQSSNLYVHHDIPLPSFPLCLALGSVVSSYQPNDDNNGVAVGNYVAVGSFEPGIEIWNLDVMNALEPTLVLGGADTRGSEENWMKMQAMMPSSTTVGGKKKNKKGKKSANTRGGRGLREGSHTDAVMGLSWNAVHKQVLASGSADGTVKLWDVTQPNGDYIRPSATLTHHTDKVQSLAWHPSEGTLLATGGYDRKVCLVDARSAAAASATQTNAVKRAKLLSDCEAIAWDPHNQQYLTAACEDGTICCWDVRKFDLDPVWSFVAHEYGGVSDISYNS
jgi:periodic tryptophan protein 1